MFISLQLTKENKMIHTTTVDTVAIQIDSNKDKTQREILERLLYFIRESGFYIGYEDNIVGIGIPKRKHFIYANNTTIATINTGVSSHGRNYYINIKFAGLKKYNDLLDTASHNSLLTICTYLNSRSIIFKLTELDVCIDIECKFEHILAICTKKSARSKYYDFLSKQAYDTTTYIEKIKKVKRDKALLRAYVYDKSAKEGLCTPITRFELKLQSKYFSKYGFRIDNIQKAFDRYHVMYFPNIEDKYRKIEEYRSYKHVYKRERERLELDNYRLHADMGYIEHFIYNMLSVGTIYDFSTH